MMLEDHWYILLGAEKEMRTEMVLIVIRLKNIISITEVYE